jgi:lysine N6-hydroxylase
MEHVDVVAVGIGPANLSLAALAEPAAELDLRCFDAKPDFQWHHGMMVPDAELQVSFIKDLVTLVDPTSRYSFLNYLAARGQLYRFLVAGRDGCSRQEFEHYYRWVAELLPTLRWNRQVARVDQRGDRFEVTFTGGAAVTCDSLVLGSGPQPVVPPCAAPHLGPQVLHGSSVMTADLDFDGKDVLVVGGGQSGAEVVNYLLSDLQTLPSSLSWVTSRGAFAPLDDSPFANEWFMPPYIGHFYRQSQAQRETLLRQQQMASDGITESLLRELYTRLYRLDLFAGDRLSCRLTPGWRLVDLRPDEKRFVAEVREVGGDRTRTHEADLVILCTGYRSTFPGYLAPLRDRLVDAAGQFRVNEDYSLAWDGPPELRIFLQNGARATHGVADPNLSLAAWRSARIINALAGRDVYRVDHNRSALSWD